MNYLLGEPDRCIVKRLHEVGRCPALVAGGQPATEFSVADQFRINIMLNIRKAAIIGAGNMGAQIAAHLANVGIPSLLMDIVPGELLPEEQSRGLTLQSPAVRNRVTKTLFDRARKLSPAPFFVPEAASLVRIGNVEDNLAEIKDADWVVEAVLERMDLKLALHAKIAALARPDALVTTNTSGLSIAGMVKDLPAGISATVFRHALFQPAALHAAAGTDPDGGDRPRAC